MKNPFVHYEKKITFLLLFLILLLAAANLINLSLLKRAEDRLNTELSQTLQFVAKTAIDYVERNEFQQDALEKLLIRKGVSKVFAIDPKTRLIMSAPPLVDPLSQPLWNGFSKRNLARLWMGTPSFSGLYKGKEGTFKAYALPFGTGRAKNILFVEGDARFLDVLQSGYRAGVAFTVCIFFMAAVVGLLYFRAVVEPYRKISQSASHLYEAAEKMGEVEFAVESFETVVRELKEKETLLEKLYSKSRNRADDLERFTKHILESIPTGVFSFDTTGKIAYSNQAGKEILNGIPRRTLRPLVDAALKEGETYLSKEIEIRDGRYLGISSSILRDPKGRTTGVTLLFRDITEMKNLEEEIAFKEKMAALGEMSAGLAHEFRNSLASILGYAKLLKRSLKSASKRPYVTALLEECLSMESTIKRFLDFSRPDRIDVEEFDLSTLLSEVIRGFKEPIQKKAITVRCKIPRKRLMTRGDPRLLRRAFMNVIQNAIEATMENGLIRVAVSEKDAGYSIRITDNGAGMKDEVKKKVFTPFFTTKRSGTGLGLSIVQKIVAAHRGSVSLSSTYGRGTTVLISLPGGIT